MTSDRLFRAAWLGVLLATAPSLAAAQISYPPSDRGPVVDTLHGISVVDPYRWLEDQEAPETREWIAAQNEFRETMMQDLPGRDAIATRLEELLKIDAMGSPAVRGDRYFFSKRAADQDLWVVYMREGVAGEDIPLLDPNILATDVPLTVGLQAISEDGRLLAYGIRRGGADEVLIRFYDVDRRRVLADHLPTARYFGIEFTPDATGYYYTHYDEEGPRLYYRELGAPEGSEQLVYGEGLGPEKIMFGQLDDSGRWLLLTVLEGTSGGNDLYLEDLQTDGAAVHMAVGTGSDYNASFAGDRIVIQTNEDAPNWRIFIADPRNPTREAWSEIIPEGEHPMQGYSLAGNHVWVNYLEDVIGRVRGYDLNGEFVREIGMPAIGSISGLRGEFDRDEAFFSFSSFHIPSTTYRYSVARDERTVWARQDVPFDSDRFTVDQVWYESRDGTRVPMFLAHAKALERNGRDPTYLTGYGGFNISRTPGFSAQYAVWMERGGVLAVPNLRGGGEFGEEWHEAGMFERKQNVFDDFIAAAEWLIEHGYTNADHLAIAGGSNGGLLVGAAMTQRPGLFGAVVCSVPLLDMLRYQMFLVGRYWVSEYGSADDPDQLEYLLDYSPYHNVEAGVAYPAVLFETGDGDTRVAPLHARKMTALMQWATASERPILLRYDTEAGHSGGLPVTKTIEDLTTRLQFVMWQLGMLDGETTSWNW
ncbi:MAG: prolyl oligopeptidase family serine peptidase [Gemmatimonadales bacterium]|jgi:prolyl oligopeptidase